MGMSSEEFYEEGFGHFAWIDLVNSEHWDGFGHLTDHLADESWVDLFLRHWDFSGRANSDYLGELKEIRVFLRKVAEQWASKHVLAAEDITTMNGALSVPVRRVFARRAQAYDMRVEPLAPGKKWLKAQIVESLALSVAEDQSDRIKMCPNPGCRWVFYDRSHGNTRKWCNARLCGNREWVRRARQSAK